MKYRYLIPAVFLALPAFLSSQVLVDFKHEAASPVEAGFLRVDVARETKVITDLAIGNGILMNAESYHNIGGRTRNTNGLTEHVAFFSDGFTAGGDPAGPDFDFSFSGLSPNTSYTFGFWTWDNQYNNRDHEVEFVNTTGGANTLVGTYYLDERTARPVSLSEGYTEFELTSDASGIVSLELRGYDRRPDHIGGPSGVMINGLTIIPEPSTYALIFAALALGFVIIRRRV